MVVSQTPPLLIMDLFLCQEAPLVRKGRGQVDRDVFNPLLSLSWWQRLVLIERLLLLGEVHNGLGILAQIMLQLLSGTHARRWFFWCPILFRTSLFWCSVPICQGRPRPIGLGEKLTEQSISF